MTELYRLHKTRLELREHHRPADGERLGRFLDSEQHSRRPFASSGVGANIDFVDVTERDVEAIPGGNLRVPRGEFVAVWAAAERNMGDDPTDWYAAGVAVTCRWLAAATVRPATGRWYVQWAPVTKRTGSAYEELVEAECLAAEALLTRRPIPRWLLGRRGWIEGIVATFRWAWQRSAEAPLAAAVRAD